MSFLPIEEEFNKELQKVRSGLELSMKEFVKSNSYGTRICMTQVLVACVATYFLQNSGLNGVNQAVGSAILYGIVAYRVQFILHDASHKALFRSAQANETVGWFFGSLVGVNFSRYRYTHMWHHRLTGSQNDPQYRDYLHGTVSRAKYFLFLVSPLFGSRVFPYLSREFGVGKKTEEAEVEDYNEPKVHPAWYATALLLVGIELYIISGFGRYPFIAIGFLAGLPTVSLFLARLRAVSEHQDFLHDRAGFTRSHRFNLFDFLFLYDANFNYHFEHHLYPGISSKHLKSISVQVDQLGRPNDTMGSSMFRTLIRGFG